MKGRGCLHRTWPAARAESCTLRLRLPGGDRHLGCHRGDYARAPEIACSTRDTRDTVLDLPLLEIGHGPENCHEDPFCCAPEDEAPAESTRGSAGACHESSQRP